MFGFRVFYLDQDFHRLLGHLDLFLRGVIWRSEVIVVHLNVIRRVYIIYHPKSVKEVEL